MAAPESGKAAFHAGLVPLLAPGAAQLFRAAYYGALRALPLGAKG